MDYKDYYQILGVSRNADARTIKQAYRKLARQYHPDVNAGDVEAEQKFKDINEAYTVLSDPEKRRLYERFGAQWQQAQRTSTAQNFDWSSWTSGGTSSTTGSHERRHRANREEFEQRFSDTRGTGGSFSEFFQQLFGGGAGGDSAPRTRTTQMGSGRNKAQTIPVEILLEEAFNGTTRTVQQGKDRFEVVIPPGVRTGSKVRINRSSGYGQLDLEVKVRPHARFTREGDNLRVKVNVDLYTALLGGESHIPTLERPVALVIPADTQNGKVFRLKGLGMPLLKNPEQRGDLLAEIDVKLPTPLSTQEKEHFRALRRLWDAGQAQN